MDIAKNRHFFSEADKCAFFEKIFKEHHIVPVDSRHVEEIKISGRYCYRKSLTAAFSTLECTAYQYGRYLIVWKGHSATPIFLMEYEFPFKIYSLGKYDFFLRKETADGRFCFERYTWKPKEQVYISEQYGVSVVPEDFSFEETRVVHNSNEWLRIYPHKSIETKSVDNTIFYEYIVKYWQD